MGVYVHIPFCAQKCYYCDFHSIVVGNQAEFKLVADNYLHSVRKEAKLYQHKLGNLSFPSLFFGGGTPSLVDPRGLGDLVVFLLESLPFEPHPEVTIEANPQSLTTEGVAVLQSAGVNRVSLGVQVFQNELLKTLGRVHEVQDIFNSVEILRKQGISNLSLDLMYGLPSQSLGDWQESLEKAISLQPEHLSCYSLIIEEETPFQIWESEGLIKVPGEDLQSEMYDLAREFLAKHDYAHYEISNFAKEGFESRHNLLYWENRPFLGLGSGATGYLARERYTNKAHVDGYIQSISKGEFPLEISTKVSLDQEMEETMMVGMRLLRGVEEQDFILRYGQSYFQVFGDEIRKLMELGLVTFTDGHLHVTERGLALENQVSAVFLR